MSRRIILAPFLFAMLFTPAVDSAGSGKLPTGFVELSTEIPALSFEYYFTSPTNFTDARVPGYGSRGAWLRRDAAVALGRVQRELSKSGLGIHVFDAYRPRRATLALAKWARDHGHQVWLDSGALSKNADPHNQGLTIDVTLIELRTGHLLDMGTGYSDLGNLNASIYTSEISAAQKESRAKLAAAMKAAWFKPYSFLWWQFTFQPQPGASAAKVFDVPYPDKAL